MARVKAVVKHSELIWRVSCFAAISVAVALGWRRLLDTKNASECILAASFFLLSVINPDRLTDDGDNSPWGKRHDTLQ